MARGEGHPVGRERGRGSRGDGCRGEAGVGGGSGCPGAGQAGGEVEQESDADRHGAGISRGSWRGWPCRADRGGVGLAWRGRGREEARDIWAWSEFGPDYTDHHVQAMDTFVFLN